MTQYTDIDESELPKIARSITGNLQGTKSFIVELEGPLGAGKTTLTRHLLQALGLPEQEPVLSPTYTYMNEYSINGQSYAHLDLYRADSRITLEDLGVWGVDSYSGMFMEWLEKLDSPPNITHKISLARGSRDDLRNISIETL